MRPSDPDPDGAAANETAGPPPELTLIHHHPGRLRVRADAFQAGDVAARVLASLEGVTGVDAVRHNDRTGSILVEYQPGVAQADNILATIAAASGLAMPGELQLRQREPGMIAIGLAREVNDIVQEVTGYRADLRTIIPAAMAAGAAYSWLAHPEARLPRWDNLLYWSYNIFAQLHRREIEEGSGREPTSAPAWRPRTVPADKPRPSET